MGLSIAIVAVVAALLVAYANGANDNFKGVATLLGSGTTDYRRALVWATVATFAGSMTAVALAGQLFKSFSGSGLVSADVVAEPTYVAAVALGAGLTILLATRLGMPVSTTHGLVGALVGAGMAAGSSIDLGRLAEKFCLPLLVSPVLALTLTVVLHRVFRRTRLRLGIHEESCVCVGREVVQVMPIAAHATAIQVAEEMSASLGSRVTCQRRYQGAVLGVGAAQLLDALHYLSAGAVSFARGLNDTAKIAALLPVAAWAGGWSAFALVGGVIAIGGLLSARRVAETMSRKITPMNHGQGFTANLVTSLVVIGASRWGLPVSTTHVSCGSLFGLGAVTGAARWATIGRILLAWVVTLPLAAALGATAYWLLHGPIFFWT